MTSTLKTFSFAPGLNLRSIDIDGSPWFVAKDVLLSLGISEAGSNLDSVEEEDKQRFNLGLRGRAPWLVSESGLYSLILKSRKPDAKTFARWVTKDVLPAIRKNGGYLTPEVAVLAVESPTVFMARALVMASSISQALTLPSGCSLQGTDLRLRPGKPHGSSDPKRRPGYRSHRPGWART